MLSRQFPIIMKVILYQIIFLVLHFLFNWIPNEFTRIISGTNESIFQHMKVGFYSYLVLTLLEYLWTRKTIRSVKGFLASRALASSILPFLLMLFFLMGPLLFNKIESIPLEIIFANLCVLLSTACTVIIERQLEKGEISKNLIFVSATIFTCHLLQFVVFTYRLPWMDVFANPPGW